MGKEFLETLLDTQNNSELQSVNWSDNKHHNIFESLAFVVLDSILALSTVYTSRITDKVIILLSYFLDVYIYLPRHIYDDTHLVLEGTVKHTHLVAWKFH